ncbi:MAG: hypothetical protein OXT74_07470 [Candidatus Poribacteria bacterium]|nr:hypothetical protein [Candidatus Poribacteria bacterium]
MLDKIAQIYGVDPAHFRQLLKLDKTVASRAKGDKNGSAIFSYGLVCCFHVILGLPVAFILLFRLLDAPVDGFDYAIIALSYTMVMTAFLSYSRLEFILNPIDYLVLAHTPVSSRTFFLAKLTRLLSSTAVMLGCLNLLPAITGCWTAERNPLFPVVYLPISLIAGFFSVGLITVITGYLTKLYSNKWLRNVARYAELAFPILFPCVYVIGPRLLPELKLVSDQLLPFLTAFYLLPNSWFAGVVAFGLGDVHYRFLILTAIAIVATILLVAGPLRSVAKGYTKYLTSLLESRRTQKPQLKLRASLVSRLFNRRETRAGADFVSAYLRRDRRTQLRVFSAVGTPVIFLVILFQDNPVWDWIGKPFTIWLALGVSAFFFFGCSTMVSSFLGQIRYSDHWKAKWIFQCAPLAVPHALWRGTLATTLIYIVLPYTILLLTLATIFWRGLSGMFYLLPGLSALLVYTGYYPKPSSRLPLSEEYIQGAWNMEQIWLLIRFIGCQLIFGTILAFLYVMYRIYLGLYIGCYAVIVIAGILIFIRTFNKKQEGEVHA